MADKKNIDIGVKATDEGASKVFDKVNRATRKMGEDAEKSSQKAEQALNDVGEAGKRAGENISAGMKQGAASTDIVDAGMAKLRTRFAEIDEWSNRMQANFAGVRNIGLGISALSLGAVLLSNKLSKVSAESDRATQSLEDMAEKRGDGGRIQELDEWAKKLTYDAAEVNSNGIKTAAADLYTYGLNADQIMQLMPVLIARSRQYHQDIQSVAKQFGQQFMHGNTGGLDQIGINIDDDTSNKINEISDLAQRQQAILDATSESAKKYGMVLTLGMTEAEKAANRNAQVMNTFYANIGQGTDSMRIKMGSAAAVVVGFANKFPGLETAIGGAIGAVGYFGGSLGVLLTTLGTVGQGITGAIEIWDKGKAFLKMLRDAVIAAAMANDVLSVSNASAAISASTLGAAEVTEAAASNSAAVAKSASAVSADALGVSNASAAISTDVLSASQVVATASANSLAAASLATKLGVAGIAVAAALTVGAVAYAVGQHIGWIDKEQSFIERLTAGWERLKDIATGANSQWRQNEKDFKAGEDAIKTQYAKDRQSGISEAEAGKKRDDALLKLNRIFAAEDNKIGDDENLIKHQENIDRLEQVTKPVAIPVIPAVTTPLMPSSASSSDTPTTNTSSAKELRKANLEQEKLAREKQRHEKAVAKLERSSRKGSSDRATRARANAGAIAQGMMMAQVAALFAPNGGRPYSTINADGSVTEYPGVNTATPAPQQKITLKPKTRVSRNNTGDFVVEILPEKFVIPNDFSRAVGAL